jgi:hypothetical protein
VKGLSNAKDEGENLSVVLEDLGITEKRAFTVVGSLLLTIVFLKTMNLANVEYNNIVLNKEEQLTFYCINIGTIFTKNTKVLQGQFKRYYRRILKYGSVIVTF